MNDGAKVLIWFDSAMNTDMRPIDLPPIT